MKTSHSLLKMQYLEEWKIKQIIQLGQNVKKNLVKK
jgi:hypothetical protein